MTSDGMHPEDIKAEVRKTGLTLTDLSVKNGLSESAVRMAILFRHSPAGERAIYEHLGLHPHEIWPNRYDKDGNRIIGRTALNTTKSGHHGHRQKRAIA